MNRSNYFNLCSKKLSYLSVEIETRGKLNVLDYNIHCEDFYAEFLNLIFGYSLKNTNQEVNNFEGIDLIDSNNKVVLQVSSTATKAKIESALGKNLSAYTDHNFKFISIIKDADNLRKKNYCNPHSLSFNPVSDIYDIKLLLNTIMHLEISMQRAVYDFLRKELDDQEENKLHDTNIADVINILSKEDLTNVENEDTRNPFSIEKKIVINNLNSAELIINDYKVYHSKITQVYSEFNQLGKNKSQSVLAHFRKTYIQLSRKYSGDDLFFNIVEKAMNEVSNSANFSKIPLEELELCVTILAVDAFIRCKIFKDPNRAEYAVA